MKSKKGVFLMIIGALMILSALLLLTYNTFEDKKAGQYADEIVNKVEYTIANNITTSESDLMPIVEIDGEEYIGYLSFPSLDMKLPVMSEWSYAKLKKAPCRQQGSISTHDLVIAGHAYLNHFRNIRDLNAGDTIIFTNMNGQNIEYCIMQMEQLKSDQSEEMLNSKWDLTIYTCNYSGSRRITVRANEK